MGRKVGGENLHNPLSARDESKERGPIRWSPTKLGYLVWKIGKKGKDLNLVYLLPWPDWPVGSQVMPAEVED